MLGSNRMHSCKEWSPWSDVILLLLHENDALSSQYFVIMPYLSSHNGVTDHLPTGLLSTFPPCHSLSMERSAVFVSLLLRIATIGPHAFVKRYISCIQTPQQVPSSSIQSVSQPPWTYKLSINGKTPSTSLHFLYLPSWSHANPATSLYILRVLNSFHKFFDCS